jgi:hypothetical protein
MIVWTWAAKYTTFAIIIIIIIIIIIKTSLYTVANQL